MFPRWPVKSIGELTGYRAGEPAAGYPEICVHEVPPVMPPAMQVSGRRIVLTCVMAFPDLALHVISGTTSNPSATSMGIPRRPVKLGDGPIGQTAGGLVVMYPLCDHGVPLLM